MDAEAVEKFFLEDGKPYEGAVVELENGKSIGEMDIICGRCGGSGRWKRRLPCLGCDGEGTKFEQVKLYTEDGLVKLNAGREKRAALKVRKETEKQALLAARFAEFRNANLSLFEAAEAMGHKTVTNLLESAREWGGLTEKQLGLLQKLVGERTAGASIYAGSAPVGEPGERRDFDVVCTASRSFTRKKFRGRGKETVNITDMVDKDGNALFAMTPSFAMAAGERAIVKATVKAHDDSGGWMKTTIYRVAILEQDLEPFAVPQASPAPSGSAPVSEADWDEEDFAAPSFSP